MRDSGEFQAGDRNATGGVTDAGTASRQPGLDAVELDAIEGVRDFGRALTRLRQRAGLSVRDVSAASGIALSTLSGYFAGTHLPAVGQELRLSRLLTACRVGASEQEGWHEVWHRLRDAARSAHPDNRAVREPRSVRPQATGPVPAEAPSHRAAARSRLVGVPAPAPRSETAAGGRAGRALLRSIRPPLARLSHEPVVRGRDGLVGRLATALGTASTPRVHVLCGLAGVGKSTVALTLARAAVAHGAQVWWVGADSAAATADAMYALAAELGASRNQLEHSSLPDLVWRLLSAQRRPWLLVVDGADDTDDVLAPGGGRVVDGTGWVRPVSGMQGMVLVTTRDGRTWRHPGPSGPARGAWFDAHLVAPVASGDAARVLLELAPRGGGPAEALALAERLGGLPLELRLAGGVLAAAARVPIDFADAETPRTFADYAASLDRGGDPSALAAPHRSAPMGRSWRLSLDMLERCGLQAARPLLHLAACLAPGPFPWTRVLRPDVLAGSPLFPGLGALSLCELVDALVDLGFVTRHREGDTELLTLPSPVRRLFRDTTEVRTRLADYFELLTRLLMVAFAEYEARDPAAWPGLEVLAGQEQAALDLVDDLGGGTGAPAVPDDLLLPVRLATCHRRVSGRLREAERICTDALPKSRRLLGPDHPDVLALEHELGRIRLGCGDAARAVRELRAVLDARVRVLGQTDPDTLTTQHYLARALLALGRVQEAHVWFARTLAARTRILGPGHQDTLATRHDLGLVLLEQGRYTVAAEILRTVLAERTVLLGADHPATLVTRQHLTRLVVETHGPDSARDAYRELASECTRVLGNAHPYAPGPRRALDEPTGAPDGAALPRTRHRGDSSGEPGRPPHPAGSNG
ncbi:tetratricopeptide repeat protein [Streptomyces sp. 1222.5]|uniref:tetratricopeptide repeat protein n=1 Tax=Streptomyces sp. 1222.5 TaxID=1881026 RepID=UPI003F4A2F6B